MRMFIYGLSGFVIGAMFAPPLAIAGRALGSGEDLVFYIASITCVLGSALGLWISHLTPQSESEEPLLPSQGFDASKYPRIPVVENVLLAFFAVSYCSHQIKDFVAGTSALSEGFVVGSVFAWIFCSVFAIGFSVRRFLKQLKAHIEFKANMSTTSSRVDAGKDDVGN